MYKLLIVEDNYIQAQSLMHYLDWRALGVAEIRTASNGMEGLEVYNEFKADIIITNITMPVLTGIDMIKRIRSVGDKPSVIYISCYDNFSYISDAIETEASAYLLKPIDQKQLEDSVKRIIKRREEKKHSSFEKNLEFIGVLRENFMYHLICSQDNNMQYLTEAYRQLDCAKFSQYMIVKFDILRDDEKYIDIYRFMQMIKNELPEYLEEVLVAEGENRFCMLVMSKKTDEAEFVDSIKAFIKICVQAAREQFDIITLAALSRVSSSFYDIPIMLKQSTRVLDDVMTPENDVYEYKNTDQAEEHYNINFIKNSIEGLMNCESNSEIEEFVEILCKVDEADEDFAIEMVYVSFWAAVQMFLSEHRIAIENVFGDSEITLYKSKRFETKEQLMQWLYNMILALRECVNKYGRDKQNDVVAKIISYINQNYKDISNVEDVARHCYISSSYARSIFKNIIGKTIYEYLLTVRMDKAQQLLARKDLKIYEVAEMVGYKSKTNFVSAFKKYTGMLPSEFQNKSIR